SSLTNVNGTIFFEAYDGVHGSELWKSNGTAAGTVLVKDIKSGTASSDPMTLINLNGTLLFVADDGVHAGLWRSDGTAAGTVLVKGVPPGIYPGDWTIVNGRLYFRSGDGVHGEELWRSDGTAAGTILVKDIKPGGNGSYPFGLTNVNGKLFF